jgi:hypothetical protein
MKKIFQTLIFFIFITCLVYLSLPGPTIPPLPNSLKSNEPGDTVEMVGVSAYYTDLSREEVINFYQRAFSRSSFFNLPLPVVLLNHPPEYTNEAIRNTVSSTFLYELVHPGRGSLFVNGWDPAEDPKYKKAKDPTQVIEINGRFYQRKITLRLVRSSLLIRILIFSFSFFFFTKLLLELKKLAISFWQAIFK